MDGLSAETLAFLIDVQSKGADQLRALSDSFNQLGVIADKLGVQIAEMQKQLDKMATSAQAAAAKTTAGAKASTDAATSQAKATEDLSKSQTDQAATAKVSADATDDLAGAQKGQADSAKVAAGASTDLADAHKEQAAQTLAAGDATVDLTDAQAKQVDIIKSFIDATADQVAAIKTATDATLDLAKAQTDAADTATASAAKFDTASDAVAGGALASKGHTAALSEHKNALEKAGSSVSSFGSQMNKVSLPILAAGAASMYMSMEFGKAMEQLHGQAGYAQKDIAGLSQQVIALAPKLAQTPQALADALYHVASVGIPVQDSLKVVSAAAIAANVGGANLEDTVNGLVTTMKSLHQPASDAAADVGLLNEIVGAGNLHMQDLVGSLGKVLPQAESFGLSLQDVGAALDVMTSRGINASMASTRLGMTFNLMGNPSAAAITSLAKIGLGSNTLANDMRKPEGLLQAVTDLKTHLDTTFPENGSRPLTIDQERQALLNYQKQLQATGVTASEQKTDMSAFASSLAQGGQAAVQQAQVLGSAFGRGRQSATILTLVQNLGDLRKEYDRLPTGAAALQRLSDASKDWELTTAGQFDHVKATIASLGVSIGSDLGPIVLPVLSDITNDLSKLVEGFEALPGPVQKAALEFLALVAVLGPVAKITGGVLSMGGAVVSAGKTVAGKILPGTAATESETVAGAGGAAGAVERAAGGIYGIDGTSVLAGTTANAIGVFLVGGATAGGIGGPASAAEEDTAADASVADRQMVLPGMERTAATTGGEVAAGGDAAAAADVAGAAGAASVAPSILSGVKGLLGGVMKGGAIAGIGYVGSQVAGSAIGGKTGKDVSSIGGDAAIGAGIGTALDAVPGLDIFANTFTGALAGAAIGALSKVVGGESYQDKLAGSLQSALPAATTQRQRQQGTASTAAADTAQAAALVQRANAMTPRANRNEQNAVNVSGTAPGAVAYAAPSAAVNAQQTTLYQQAGTDAFKGLQAGWNTYQHLSVPTMVQEFVAEFDKAGVTDRMRDQGATDMLAYVNQMQASGKIAGPGAVGQVLSSLQQAFPGVDAYMKSQGISSGKDFSTQLANSMDFTAATGKLTTFDTQIVNDWQGLKAPTQTSWQGIVGVVGQQLDYLRAVMQTSHGQTQADAEQAYARLKSLALTSLAAMVSSTGTQMDALAQETKQGVSGAAGNMQAVFANSTSTINQLYGAGLLTASKGNAEIGKLLQNALKIVGSKSSAGQQLIAASTLPGTGAAGVSAGATFGSSPSASLGGLATGGRVPGHGLADNVPVLTPAGGLRAVVAPDEMMWVANRHTESRVDSMLAPYGTTLAGEILGEGKPHSAPMYATGGTLNKAQLEALWVQGGGPPSVENVAAAIALAESAGRDVVQQGQPYATTGVGYWQITPGGSLDPLTNAREAVSKYQAAHGFSPWTTFNDGAYRQYLGAGSGASSFAGIAAPTIKAPSLSGTGAVADMTRGMWAQVTAAANQQLARAAAAGGLGDLAGQAPGAAAAPTSLTGLSGGLAQMVQEANAIAAARYNYEWGGGHTSIGEPSHGSGHGSGPGVGFDCSGAVSAILHAAGLIAAPMVAADFMSWGQPGPGAHVSIFADPVHTFMEIDGRYFGTSAQNPGGGATWMPAFPGDIGGPRHPPGYATGGGIDWPGLDPSMIGPAGLLPGMAGGGRLGWAGAFGSGGTATASRPTLAMFGDRGAETALFVPHAETGAQLLASIGVTPPASTTTSDPNKLVEGLNPDNNQIEWHTAAQWKQIRLAHSQAAANTTAQNKQAAATPAVESQIMAGSLNLGQVLGKPTGANPVPASINIPQDIDTLTATVWSKVVASITATLKAATGTQGAGFDVQVTGALAGMPQNTRTSGLLTKAVGDSAKNVMANLKNQPAGSAVKDDNIATNQISQLIADARKAGQTSLIAGLQKDIQTAITDTASAIVKDTGPSVTDDKAAMGALQGLIAKARATGSSAIIGSLQKTIATAIKTLGSDIVTQAEATGTIAGTDTGLTQLKTLIAAAKKDNDSTLAATLLKDAESLIKTTGSNIVTQAATITTGNIATATGPALAQLQSLIAKAKKDNDATLVAALGKDMTSTLETAGKNIVSVAQSETGSAATGASASAISQTQALIGKAVQAGNTAAANALLKNVTTLADNWQSAIQANLATTQNSQSLAEQMKIAQQTLAAPNAAVLPTSATDPGYLLQQIQTEQGGQLQDAAEQTSLQQALAQAVASHNQNLVAAVQDQLTTVTDAISQSQVNVANLQIAYQQAIYQAFLTGIQNAAAALDQVSSNQGTIAAIAQDYQTVNETSNDQIQQDISNQGGIASPAQIAQVNANLQTFIQGVNAQVSPLAGGLSTSQINSLMANPSSALSDTGGLLAAAGPNSELGVDLSAYESGTLNPTDEASMGATILSLIQKISDLEASIATQTDATNQLTGATIDNTQITQQLTGSVTYTFQNQQYTVGQSSANLTAPAVGF